MPGERSTAVTRWPSRARRRERNPKQQPELHDRAERQLGGSVVHRGHARVRPAGRTAAGELAEGVAVEREPGRADHGHERALERARRDQAGGDEVVGDPPGEVVAELGGRDAVAHVPVGVERQSGGAGHLRSVGTGSPLRAWLDGRAGAGPIGCGGAVRPRSAARPGTLAGCSRWPRDSPCGSTICAPRPRRSPSCAATPRACSARAALGGTGGMAGRDPVLAGWRARYDAMAAAQWAASTTAVSTLGAIAAKLSNTADTYLAAEHDATARFGRQPATPPEGAAGDAKGRGRRRPRRAAIAARVGRGRRPGAATGPRPGGRTGPGGRASARAGVARPGAAGRRGRGRAAAQHRARRAGRARRPRRVLPRRRPGAVARGGGVLVRRWRTGWAASRAPAMRRSGGSPTPGDGAAFSAMRTFWATRFTPCATDPLFNAVVNGAGTLRDSCGALADLIEHTRAAVRRRGRRGRRGHGAARAARQAAGQARVEHPRAGAAGRRGRAGRRLPQRRAQRLPLRARPARRAPAPRGRAAPPPGGRAARPGRAGRGGPHRRRPDRAARRSPAPPGTRRRAPTPRPTRSTSPRSRSPISSPATDQEAVMPRAPGSPARPSSPAGGPTTRSSRRRCRSPAIPRSCSAALSRDGGWPPATTTGSGSG